MSSKRSTEHATFVIERIYDASPARVFDAWADPAAKAQWFDPTGSAGERTFDFQVGGREHYTAPLPDGRLFGYDSRFLEIVAGHRIVYSYTIEFDRIRISASLVTIEITPSGERTRLLNTEQGVYLDGGDTSASREHGTRALYDKLELALAS